MEMDNRPPSSPARCLHPRPASNPQSVVARAAAGSRVKRAYLAHHVILQLVAFLFIHYSHTTYQVIAGLCTIRFLSAVRAVAVRCKHPFAFRPGLSPEDPWLLTPPAGPRGGRLVPTIAYCKLTALLHSRISSIFHCVFTHIHFPQSNSASNTADP